jgi:hypothetical protein
MHPAHCMHFPAMGLAKVYPFFIRGFSILSRQIQHQRILESRGLIPRGLDISHPDDMIVALEALAECGDPDANRLLDWMGVERRNSVLAWFIGRDEDDGYSDEDFSDDGYYDDGYC